MNNKVKNRLGKYLQECRQAAGLSQGEVSKALGYTTPQFISNWERDVSAPPMDKLSELVRLIKIKPEIVMDLLIEDMAVSIRSDFVEHNLVHRKRISK